MLMKKTTLCVVLIALCIASAGCCNSEKHSTAATINTPTTMVATSNLNDVGRITVDPSNFNDGRVGYTIQFTAKVFNRAGKPISRATTWSIGEGSSGDGTIDSNGVLFPKKIGTIIVMAKAGDVTSTALVEIKRSKDESYHYKYRYISYNNDDDDDDDHHYDDYYNLNDHNDLCNRAHNHGTSC
jgi:hypothetical protein